VAEAFAGVGDLVARFGEKWVRQTKGEWANKPMEWEPWQRDWLTELFLVDRHGDRIYREAGLWVPRKNGKSTMAAVIALYLLMAAGENAPEVYAAAGSKEQARNVFDQARAFIEASPRLQAFLTPQRNVIACKANGGIFRALSSDAPLQHGLNPFGVVIDELWAHKDPELYYALTTGQLARRNPLVVSISTPGWDRDTIAWQVYEYGRRLAAKGLGHMRDVGYLFREFAAPPGAPHDDPAVWRQANPSSWIIERDLARECERLPENVFRRLHLAQWTENEEAWITAAAWDACEGQPQLDPDEPTWGMVDVGIKRDSAAIVWAQWDGDQVQVRQTILAPERQGRGYGVADIRARVAREAQAFTALKEVNYDPWSFRESAEILAERGLPMVEFPQTAGRMAPASENIFELITHGRIVHDGDREMREHVLNAVAAPTDRGGWRISKRKSQARIDACVALAGAADRAVEMRNAKPPSRVVVFG
jgi:phage terminase large subunit-like protein